MSHRRYVVVPGDNLWHISKVKLGHGNQWRRIWRYNNRADVIRVTGRGIPDPDLIYPGQVLLIPVIPHHHQGPHHHRSNSHSSAPADHLPSAASTPLSGSGQPLRSSSSGTSLSSQLPKIESPISFKYRLDDLRFPPIDSGVAILEMRMTGDVILMTSRTYPALYVTQRREVEMQVTSQINQGFGSLVNDTRLLFDSSTNTLTYRSMLVSQSKTPNAPSTAVGVQMDSSSPLPKLRFEIRYPKLEGSLPLFNYAAVDVKVVVELTPKPPQVTLSPEPVRVTETVPARAPSRWGRVIGTGLLVVGGAIVVGTIVEDFFTAGGGVADDPASFAAAGATIARGLRMIRGVQAVLPLATAPAALMLSVGVQPTGTPSAQTQNR